jgi:purine nucleosidase
MTLLPRVILDCDPGTDDAIALFLALASPEFSLTAVTVAAGNVGLISTSANARAILALAGSSVPVHEGADRPLLGGVSDASHIHGADGLNGVVLPPGHPPSATLAADAIRALLRHGAADTLVGIGPATNLALALMTEPQLTTHLRRVVLMSGAMHRGNITPAAEFNAAADPEALAALLATGCKPVFATLELTAQAMLTPARLAALRRRGGGKCLTASCDIMQASLRPSGTPLHDPCAIAWLIRPELFVARDCTITVDLAPGPTRGRTVFSEPTTSPNATVLEALDTKGFFDLLGERLATLP